MAEALDGASFLLLQHILEHIQKLEERSVRLENQILVNLNRLERQQEKIMTAFDDIQAAIDGFDEATNELGTKLDGIAGRIDRILAQIQGGLSAEQAEAVRARLAGEVADLRVQSARAAELGSDPENPIP